MTNQSRIEFEAWAATKGMAMHLARSESGLYVSRVTQNYMDCWMDSQAKKADELEALREFKRHMVEMREADGFESWAEVLVTVDQLKAEVEALRGVMAAVVSEIPHARYVSPGNSPGHSHRRPGIWDEDNGAKAGKECGWCKVWNTAIAMSKESGHD